MVESVIRKAIANDAAQIAALLGELGYPASAQSVKNRLINLSSNNGDVVFVADYGGEITGFLSLHVIPLLHIDGRWGRITALSVGSRFRRHGVGRRLVSAAENFAWENGCVRIEVTSGNQRSDAHAFYKAAGYGLDDHSHRFLKSQPRQG